MKCPPKSYLAGLRQVCVTRHRIIRSNHRSQFRRKAEKGKTPTEKKKLKPYFLALWILVSFLVVLQGTIRPFWFDHHNKPPIFVSKRNIIKFKIWSSDRKVDLKTFFLYVSTIFFIFLCVNYFWHRKKWKTFWLKLEK